jgi:HlyD family secretion protein
MTRRATRLGSVIGAVLLVAACGGNDQAPARRASGYVEATEVRVAARVPGRVAEVNALEGQRIDKGAVVATLSPAELDIALRRAAAERAQADAQLRLLQRGARAEDVQQAEAQVAAAASDERAAEAERVAAAADETRFQQLVDRRAGSEKQRDDAVARRRLAEARVAAAADRVAAARATLARLQAGSRAEEIEAARARVASADAQIASLEHDRAETSIVAPVSGTVTSRLVEPGELVAPGTPVAVIVDLDRAWVNAYVEEPLVPSLRTGASAEVVSDAGDRLAGSIAFIAPRAEFTPRNVQTAAERSRLVYRVRVTVDNRNGVLKPGMPVEVNFAEAQGN